MHTCAVDYSSSLLCEGRGACFVVSPGSGSLAPFSTARVELTAYSDMWGKYSDQLICKVRHSHVTSNYELLLCIVMCKKRCYSHFVTFGE